MVRVSGVKLLELPVGRGRQDDCCSETVHLPAQWIGGTVVAVVVFWPGGNVVMVLLMTFETSTSKCGTNVFQNATVPIYLLDHVTFSRYSLAEVK